MTVTVGGRAVGVELRYDHTAVGRWVAGEQPNSPGPELIAEVLTEVLGRRVVPSDCGMSGGQNPADLGLEFSLSLTEATAAATALWGSDVERRRFLLGASYAVAVYPAASMRWGQSLNMSDGYLRGRAFNLCLLASALAHDDPHESARVGTEALDIISRLESHRTHAYLREVRHRLAAYTALPDIEHFRRQVLAITARTD
ncbi:hypothetical protein [Nocardia sp. NPDC057440]|uniref:hypothetical protein n=1 Tax=Nocardia sp. NPDC057440 TaxID=3346134 RepID=UPI0036720F32